MGVVKTAQQGGVLFSKLFRFVQRLRPGSLNEGQRYLAGKLSDFSLIGTVDGGDLAPL